MTLRRMLRSKIHRATVTGADLNYEGSITIDAELMAAADLVESEAVSVWNITRGSRFETYTIQAAAGSGEICINGAAAHLVQAGDLIIIACFGYLDEAELLDYQPKIIFLDECNRIREIRSELPGPHSQHGRAVC